MNLFLFICLCCGAALLPLLYFLAKAVRDVFTVQQEKHRRVEKRARIRHVQIMNERGRSVPFVKLKVEVFSGGEEGMIADAEGFYPHGEAVCLRPGAVVWVRQRPYGAAQLQVVKRPALPKKPIASKHGHEAGQPAYNTAKRQPLKNGSEEGKSFISARTNPVQSPAAHRRRLAAR